jgi:AAA family ATP:ADP antiporter
MGLGQKIADRLHVGTLDAPERAVALLMSAHVFVLMAAYTIAKVLRDSMFLSSYGSDALPYGYLGVALVAVVMMSLLPRLRVVTGRIQNLAHWFALAASLAAALLFHARWHWLPALYYVWVGSQAMLLISHFWLAALDAWDSRRARTLFPILAGFGLLGGMAGGGLARWGAQRIGDGGLLWAVFGLLCVVHVLNFVLGGQAAARPLSAHGSGTSRFKTIFTSPYLRTLTAALLLAVIVSTLIDFQFKALAQKVYTEPGTLTRFLGGFYGVLNALSLLVQFGISGWLLRRLGPGVAGALQPVSGLVLAAWCLAAPVWGAVLVMRGIQGLIFQTLGKPTSEIYFMAIRPPERRQIKPALDILVERGADALVGVLILVMLHTIGIDIRYVAGLAVLASAVWLFLLYKLQRAYVRAFKEILAYSWVESDAGLESLRDSGALAAMSQVLEEALAEGDERKAVTTLRLVVLTHHPRLLATVRAAAKHSSIPIQTAAIRALIALRAAGEGTTVEPLIESDDEELARAAVEYMLRLGGDASAIAGRLLESDRSAVRLAALEVLRRFPALATGKVDLAWIDARIEIGTPEALIEASTALPLLAGAPAAERLRLLLDHPDREVRRAALGALAARPDPELLENALTHLTDPDVAGDAQAAVAAFGDLAVPALARQLASNASDEIKARAAAALARLGTQRAARVLKELARSSDPVARYLGFRNLNRIVAQRHRREFKPQLARRMFLRELRDYKATILPALAIPDDASPALRLLAASYEESADRAVERACRALACAHDPRPFRGVYEGLKAGSSREALGRAIEYLSQLLPYKVFRPVKVLFEERDRLRERIDEAPSVEIPQVADVVRRAWETGDAWLRACALRAARELPQFDPAEWKPVENEDPVVVAELAAVTPRGAGGAC